MFLDLNIDLNLVMGFFLKQNSEIGDENIRLRPDMFKKAKIDFQKFSR